MASKNEAISVRSARLDQIVLGHDAGSKNGRARVGEGLNRESLLDALSVLYNECHKESQKNADKQVAEFVQKYRPIMAETQSLRVNYDDFTVKDLIGKGYFGEVHLVKEKQSQDRYAMKRIHKLGITSSQVREERDIMAQHKSDWITSLQYAFQDPEYLYLVMEYLPGGDLLSLMIRNGAFEEDWARFYLAELTEALNTLHEMGYVHRDIKPENILLDRCGHLKLADFGNAAQLNKDGSVISLSPVGTPDYIAPELLQTLSTIHITKSVHDVTCDFWSMGIIGYELVTEVTPFHEENVHETYSKILYHCDAHTLKPKLEYPDKVTASDEFKSLIDSLVTIVDRRLTYKKIVAHPFFRGINFASLRDQVPPFIPNVSGDDDTSNFEDIDRTGRRSTFLKKGKGTPLKKTHFSGEDLPHIGYSFVYQQSDVAGVRLCDPTVDNQMVKLQAKVKEQNKMIVEQNIEIKSLQRNVMVQDKRVAEMTSSGKMMREARVEVENLKEALKEKTKELAASKTEVKTLKSSLKIEEEQRLKSDTSIAEVLQSTYQKWEKAKKLSDQNYEKQIAEKRSEIQQLNEKLSLNEAQLRNQLSECEHLQDTLKNYKAMVKKSKEQLTGDRTEFDKCKAELTASYEKKMTDLKKQLHEENEKRQQECVQQTRLRSELRDSISAHDSVTGMKRSLDKGMHEIRTRLDKQIEENRSLRETKVGAEKALVELQRKYDELEAQMTAQLEQVIASNRSSMTEEAQFRSAQGSLQDINAAMMEEQLRHDLTVAKENETMQRQRADDLEKIKERLEVAMAKFETNTAGGLLERQNNKLEDQLVKAREEAIVERQASRSAHLSVYKLEKQLEELAAEKKLTARRVELMEQRMSKMKEDRQELEGRIKINTELVASKDRELSKLRRDIDDLKEAVRKENENWRESEAERIKEKREVVEHIAKVQKLEELIEEGKRRLGSLQQKNEALQFENKRMHNERDMGDSELGHMQDSLHGLQVKYDNLNHNYNMLKEACNITDVQMSEVEQLLEREQKRAAEAKTQLEKQLACTKDKDEELAKIRLQYTQEMAKRSELDEKCVQLQSDLLDARDQLEKVATNMASQQDSLIDKTSNLFTLQERVEVLTVDLENMQRSSGNYLKEVELLKEENSRILTEYFVAREDGQKSSSELKQAALDIHELRQEIEHLNQILSEQKNYYVQRDIKSEATLAQHKKLIDYLQAKVEDLSNRKKKSLVEKIFGSHDNPEGTPMPLSHRKENVAPAYATETLQYRKMQEDLRRERCRNNQLKEKLLRTKSELIKNNAPSAPPAEVVAAVINQEEVVVHSNKEEERMVRQEIGWSFKEAKAASSTTSTTSESCEDQHRFELTLESPSKLNSGLYCLACGKVVLTSNTFMRCKGCRIVIHRKCRGNVPASAMACDTTTEGSLLLAESTTGPSMEAIDDVDAPQRIGRTIVTSATIESCRKDYGGDFLFRTKDLSPPVLVHCVNEVNSDYLLLGCATGLYSYHYQTRRLTHIHGLDCVDYIELNRSSNKAILIGNDQENLYQCDVRQLISRSQSPKPKLEAQVLDLPFANRNCNERWHLVKINGDHDQMMAVAATSSRIVILKFDTGKQIFKPVRALDTATAVSSVLFTRHTALVSSDRFFEIDMGTYTAEEFVDISDPQASHLKRCRPMATFKIGKNEFLLCYEEFGIYVDEYGCRSRPQEVDWTYTPTGFLFRNGILFVSHFNMVQVMRVYRSSAHEISVNYEDNEVDVDGEVIENIKAFIPLSRPKLMGSCGKLDVFCMVTVPDTETHELIVIDGMKSLRAIMSASVETLATTSNFPSTRCSSQSTLNSE